MLGLKLINLIMQIFSTCICALYRTSVTAFTTSIKYKTAQKFEHSGECLHQTMFTCLTCAKFITIIDGHFQEVWCRSTRWIQHKQNKLKLLHTLGQPVVCWLYLMRFDFQLSQAQSHIIKDNLWPRFEVGHLITQCDTLSQFKATATEDSWRQSSGSVWIFWLKSQCVNAAMTLV